MATTHPAPVTDPAAVPPPACFDLFSVFETVTAVVPDNELVVWRDRRLTYGQVHRRATRLASHLAAAGLGLRVERTTLAGHQSGQDHLALYLRNGNEYLEAMLGAYRARVVPFNVNYRYVDDELLHVLGGGDARGLVYASEFAGTVARIRPRLPRMTELIQVADGTGAGLLPGARWWDDVVGTDRPGPPPAAPSGDDLYMLYTGGTTGLPKAVLWRQHDIFIAAMGGRPPGAAHTFGSYQEIARAAAEGRGGIRIMLVAPFMHGAAQWASFHAITNGGAVVLPDNVTTFDAADVLATSARERVLSIPVTGDAVARPLVEELERSPYDLSHLAAVNNGGATLSPVVKERLLAALPHVVVLDAVGSSEGGIQVSRLSAAGAGADPGAFDPGPESAILDEERHRRLRPDEHQVGWLAQHGHVPLGYLGDEAATGRTFPVVDGVRYSVPGDRARYLADGRLQLLGRDSSVINSGGEKIYAEEVEQALAAHPAVRDAMVLGRPSARWGSEVVALVQLADGASVTPDDLMAHCAQGMARYKVPKAVAFLPELRRSPAGKADRRWAGEQVAALWGDRTA